MIVGESNPGEGNNSSCRGHALFIDCSTLTTQDTWNSLVAPTVIWLVFINWELPSPGFLKVNLNGNMRGSREGAGFVSHISKSRFMAIGGVT